MQHPYVGIVIATVIAIALMAMQVWSDGVQTRRAITSAEIMARNEARIEAMDDRLDIHKERIEALSTRVSVLEFELYRTPVE